MPVMKRVWNLAKVGLAGGVVAAVFFAMTTAGPQGEVSKADADIVDFMPGDVFAGRNTTEIITKSGLTPRAYEVNGNKLLFAVGETEADPKDVLDYYQTQFVKAGINSQKWLTTPNGKGLPEEAKLKHADLGRKQLHAMNHGEVIPYFATDDYVSMGGPILRGKPIDELIEEFAKNPPNSRVSIYKGWRFIDAQKQATGKTRVTSVWADDHFDFAAMRNPNEAKLGPNMKVPSCPGCILVNRTRSLEPDEPYGIEQYRTTLETQTALDFYKKSMLARGWELSDSTQVMEFVATKVPDMPFNTRGKFYSFAKGDELVMVTAMSHPQAGTVVSVAEMK